MPVLLRTCMIVCARLEEAIFAATRNPAKSIGIYDEVGSLSVGKKADILLVTDDLELREVL